MFGSTTEYLFLPRPTIFFTVYPELVSKWYEPILSLEEDTFRITLDVSDFKPNEISVKLSEGRVIRIEGKHEEKRDHQGYISRHFARKYVLPFDYDLKKIKSALTTDGVLIITVPKSERRKNMEDKIIPISKIGKPFKQVDENKINLKHKL